jgi:hypothetical protein
MHKRNDQINSEDTYRIILGSNKNSDVYKRGKILDTNQLKQKQF